MKLLSFDIFAAMKNRIGSILVIIMFVICGTNEINGQGYNIGLRAGTNFSTHLGPTEVGESTGISNGFHFGLNYQYNFSDVLGLRAELLYVQNGKTTEYKGPSYYVFNTGTSIIHDEGIADYNLNVSTANLSIPVTVHFELSRKIEVFGGAYLNFLVGPRGSGVLDYYSTIDSAGITFIQSHDYNYYSDEPAEANFIATPIVLIIDGSNYQLPRIVGAYYQQSTVNEKKYKTIDFGLTAGTNYYFNPGFYLGLRAEYGFRDLTNRDTDFSLISLDENKNFIRRDDRDTHFGFQVSLGFKF